MKRFKYFLIYILLILSILGAGYEEILNDKNKQLENIKQDIEAARKIISENKNEKEHLRPEMDSLITQLDGINKFLKDYESQRFLSPLEITRESNIVLSLEGEVAEIQESFKNKIVNLYKHGKNYELELLLSAKTPNELLRRNEYLQRFSRNRTKELKELETKKFILEEKKKLLSLSTSSKRFYIEAERNLKTRLETRLEELSQLKYRLDDENKTNEYKIELKKREQINIVDFIKNFTENRNTFKGSKSSRINYPSQVSGHMLLFEKLKTILNIPVDVAVIKNEFGGYTDNASSAVSFNNGLDFSITRGSKVYCVADGIVEITGQLPYYGNVIIVNHDSGYRTVYTVLEEVFVKSGDEVRTNQLLGRTGENQDGQIFHFEIWKDKTPLNPREWLRF